MLCQDGRPRRLVHAHCWLVLLVLVVGCRHAAYRWDVAKHEPRAVDPVVLDHSDDCASAPKIPGDDDWGGHVEVCPGGGTSPTFVAAYAEIDDQGFAWDPEQLTQSLAALEQHRSTSGAIVLVYVHGWEHDAARNDTNVRNFRRVLHRRAAVETRRGTKRAVLGLFLGWRGRTRDTAVRFSFWARRKGAHRVGERDGAGVLDIIDRMVARWRTEERAKGHELTNALAVGHSFGAAIIHEAWHARLEADLAARAAGRTPRRAAGFDLLALVNPALEAAAFRRMYEVGQRVPDDRARPEVVVIQAENDCNTKRHFAMAMAAMQGRGLVRRDGQRETERALRKVAVGHYPWPGRYDSKEIVCREREGRGGMPPSAFDPSTPRAKRDPGKDDVVRIVEFCSATLKEHADVCELERAEPRHAVSVVFDREEELMDYHSHVFSDSLWTLLWGWLDASRGP